MAKLSMSAPSLLFVGWLLYQPFNKITGEPAGAAAASLAHAFGLLLAPVMSGSLTPLGQMDRLCLVSRLCCDG